MTVELDRTDYNQYLELEKMLAQNNARRKTAQRPVSKKEAGIQAVAIRKGQFVQQETERHLERSPRRDEFTRQGVEERPQRSTQRQSAAKASSRASYDTRRKSATAYQGKHVANRASKARHYKAKAHSHGAQKAVAISLASILASLGIYAGVTSTKDASDMVVTMPEVSYIENYDGYLEDNYEEAISSPEIEIMQSEREILTERVNEILENDPEARRAFDDIELALTRASKELNMNAADVIQDVCRTYGGDMPVTIPICVLEHESGGKMTNWRTGDILLGGAGDTGFFQITQICEDDVNGRLNPDGKIRTKENMQDNIEIGIISLAHNYNVWNGDVAKILSAYNAGGSFVANGGIRENYVRECRDEHLAVLNQYPELWEYILGRDYLNQDEDDGIYHIAIDDLGMAQYDFDQLNYNPYA